MKHLKKQQNKIHILTYIALLITIALSGLYIIKYCYDIYNSKQQNYLLEKLSVNVDSTNSSSTLDTNTNFNLSLKSNILQSSDNSISPINLENYQNQDISSSEVKTERMLQVEELKKQNEDIVGWLEIENTDINFPVVQGEDNTFYMKHNYLKKYSKNGAILLDKDYVWDPPSSNLLIYGHNNKNGTMFQSLLKYKDKKYYNLHPEIKFTTNDSDSTYEIFAVFESRVYYKSEKNVFRYYYFVNAKNEKEYNEYVKNAKKASFYDTGKTAKYGDQLMTLSTCSYHTKNGRFAVVAKKIVTSTTD